MVAEPALTGSRLRQGADVFLFLAAVAIFLAVGLFNVGQPLLEQHAFRQTQTALTAYWMRSDGFSLAYETPVLGAPWSIPFEFPVYQAVVAAASWLTGLPLDAVGRVANLLASLLVCVPLYHCLRLLGVVRGAGLYACALYLTAPIYLFWSGAFMIEGLALLLTLAAAYYLLKMYVHGATRRDLLLFSLLLVLGLLQKITTAALPVLVGCVAFGLRWLRGLRAGTPLRSPATRELLWVATAVGIAFGLAVAWVSYTDAVKSLNTFGRFLTSSSVSLSSWNYGSLEQRLSKEFWVDVIARRIVLPSTAGGVALLAFAAVLRSHTPRGYRVAAGLGLLLFAAPLAIFTNLHIVHDYYQTANLVFLLAATGVAVHAACARLPQRLAFAAPLVLAALVAANLKYFQRQYYPQKSAHISAENNRTLALATFLQARTPADRPLLLLGLDWSSEVPYYAERKALAVPWWTKLELDAIRDPERFLPALPGAVVSCPTPNVAELRAAIEARFPGSRVERVDECLVYLPG